jgi:hypothetical protein
MVVRGQQVSPLSNSEPGRGNFISEVEKEGRPTPSQEVLRDAQNMKVIAERAAATGD